LLETDAGVVAFEASVSLGGYSLPEDARIYVEAYRQTTWMRFSFGAVSAVAVPEDRRLVEFDSPDGVRFRVRVTSVGEPEGMILAEADKIRPRLPGEEDSENMPLLAVRADDGLGEQVYRMNFDDDPVLLVNAKVGDWRALARDPVFGSLVFPTLMREVLTRILHVDKHLELEDELNWRTHWLNFSMALPGALSLPSEYEEVAIDDWIDEAVSAFCRRHTSLACFKEYWIKEGSS